MKAKGKLLNACLLGASLVGYLEWGKDNKQFLFQAEAQILSTLFTHPASAIHPFTLLPLLGQILLLVTLFQNKPSKVLTFTGMAGVGLLLVFMFVVGLISVNYKIVLSTLPFLVVGFMIISHHQKKQ
jgi:cobalamin biosynthesis protein CobD/CbiB